MEDQIYTVKAPDGTIIKVKGPAGASQDEVIKQAQTLYAAQKKPTENVAPSNVPYGPEKPVDNVTPAANAPANMEPAPQGIADTFIRVLKAGLMNQPMEAGSAIKGYFTKNSTNNKLADLGNLVRTGASTASGAAMGLGTGSAVASSATMAFVDQALRKATGQGTGGTMVLPDNAINAGIEGTVGNELGSRALGVVGKGLSEAFKPGSIKIPGMTDELRNLGPTYGQVTGHDLVEGLFAKGTKQKAVTESITAADARVKEFVTQLTGMRSPANPRLAEVMQAEVKQGFQNAVDASNLEAKNFLGISELPTNQLHIPQKPVIIDTGLKDPFGFPITRSVPTPDKIVSGPVNLDATITKAAEIADSMNKSAVKPDPDSPLLHAIQDLFDATNTKLGTDGKVLSHEPISAGDAWKTKQVVDKLGYGNPVEGLNATDSQFISLSKSLNQDIDKAIPKWLDSSNAAQDSWENAKAIVQKRHEIFSPMGESGGGVKTLLNTANAPDVAVEAIFNDRRKLQRFLETGDMVVNGRQIVASNAKRDMQGYAINRIWDKGFTPTDPLNKTIGTADGTKMASDWIEFANSDEGKQLFSQSQIKNYNDFFDAVRKTANSPNASTRWIMMNFGTRVVSLGTSILAGAGALAGGLLGSAGVVTGALGLSGLARVMANKKAAPVFLAMMHGRPLGMSFQLGSRMIMQALSGALMTLNKEDGSTTEGTVSTDGRFVPAKNSTDSSIANDGNK